VRGSSVSAWYFLAHCEEVQFKEHIRDTEFGLQHQACVSDEIVNNTKWPLRWLRRECQTAKRIPTNYADGTYDGAWQLFDLAAEYSDFENAFTYASLGCIELSLDGNRLRATPELRSDTRYEAYDRLIKPVHANFGGDAREFLSSVDQAVQVSGTNFTYPLNPRVVGRGMEFIAELLPASYMLPLEWRFPRYSVADFERVALAIQALALIHLRSRLRAAAIGCKGCGYANSILLIGVEELPARIVRYTGLSASAVQNVLADLTYESAGQRNADPALQPLIPLTATTIAITPSLIVGNDLRRNFAVLLNRMPPAKAAYSQLNAQRERDRREAVVSASSGAGYRTWNGKWPGRSDLPDIDLAIICDREKHCLIVELKSFLEPAETREIIQRDEEVAKGIHQGNRLRAAFHNKPTEVLRCLQVDNQYEFSFVVASESGIGSCLLKDRSIAVIRTGHLLKKIGTFASLKDMCVWLDRGAFLPVKGVHYDEVPLIKRIGPWELDWYGIRPLSPDVFE
jgi:hypothetical protein